MSKTLTDTGSVKAPQPRSKKPDEALASLMRQCARAERCSGDALRLMKRWGVADSDARKVLERLVRERFIDDQRYADAYVREKSRFSGWGAYKIRLSLRAKRIAAEVVERALTQIERSESAETLARIIERKAARTPHKDLWDLKGKLMRFGLSRGFDYDDVMATVEQCLRERE